LGDKPTIVVATNNLGKLKEFALLLPNFKIISQSSLSITPEEELGETFFENSLQKARVANNASGMVSLGDDSGLIVPALNNLPGLHSARYAHENATDEENRQHLRNELEALDLDQTKAYFVCVFSFSTSFCRFLPVDCNRAAGRLCKNNNARSQWIWL
jgi:non-canonical purine NTP pyrophosphatase (RdgB/HAM1 family)